MDAFLSDPGWLGVIVGVFLGGVISSTFYFVGRERARPFYTSRSLRIIETNPVPGLEDMDIVFDGQSVPRLTKTLVTIWNAGRKTMRGEDVVDDDPIRLMFDGKVLRTRVLRSTRGVIQFSAEPGGYGPNSVMCTFDFLDRRDGARIEILHTGTRNPPVLEGTIKGIPEGFIRDPRSSPVPRQEPTGSALRKWYRKRRWLLPLFLMTSGVAYVIAATTGPPSNLGVPGEEPEKFSVLELLQGMIFFVAGLFGFWSRRRKYPPELDVDTAEEDEA